MNVSLIKDKIKLISSSDVLRVHIYAKMTEKGVDIDQFSHRDMCIISQLAARGGVNTSEDIYELAKVCYDLELSKTVSVQAIRNVLGKARDHGIVKRPRSCKWHMSLDYVPKFTVNPEIVLESIVHNVSIL